MILLFYYLAFEYLLCIQHFNSGFRTCDIVFQKGQIHFIGFAFFAILQEIGYMYWKLKCLNLCLWQCKFTCPFS